MANLQALFSESQPKKRDTRPTMVIRLIHYSKMVDNEKQYCDEEDKEEIISLAWQIKADGGLLQPCIVRKSDADEYEIIAGHKRRRAIKYLVEEEKEEKYALIP